MGLTQGSPSTSTLTLVGVVLVSGSTSPGWPLGMVETFPPPPPLPAPGGLPMNARPSPTRFAYKDEYEKFKLYLTIILIVISFTCRFLLNSR